MSREGSEDYKVIADACTNWWRELQSLNPAGKPVVIQNGGEKAPDRAALAQLRRIGVIDLGGAPAVDVAGALNTSAFRMLMARLQGLPIGDWQVGRWLASKAEEWEPFAIAAATLAYIREDAGGRRGATARLLGQPRGGVGARAKTASSQMPDSSGSSAPATIGPAFLLRHSASLLF